MIDTASETVLNLREACERLSGRRAGRRTPFDPRSLDTRGPRRDPLESLHVGTALQRGGEGSRPNLRSWPVAGGADPTPAWAAEILGVQFSALAQLAKEWEVSE